MQYNDLKTFVYGIISRSNSLCDIDELRSARMLSFDQRVNDRVSLIGRCTYRWKSMTDPMGIADRRDNNLKLKITSVSAKKNKH